jgi:fatty-acyl-CoA synthase
METGHDVPHDGVSQGEVLLRGPWIIERYHKLEEDQPVPRRLLAQRRPRHHRPRRLPQAHRPSQGRHQKRRRMDLLHRHGNAITAHPRIKEAAVIGAWHPQWQERPVVLAVTDNGQEIPIGDIHQLLSGSFAKWQLPDHVIYVDTLPRTSVGKLNKKAMRAAYADVYRQATSVAPS